jgi:Trypsin
MGWRKGQPYRGGDEQNDYSKARAPLPLAEAILRETEILPERHHIKRAVSQTARFDLAMACENDPPAVITRLVRSHRCGSDAAWQVEVSVADGELRPSRPKALKVVQVHRSILARDAIASLAASMPHGDGKILVRPQLRRLPEPYTIRFGDLRYQPTTIFNPDGRRAYYDESYPWRCLVRITTPRGWSGSGVLIGPRHVLTASHCVDWTRVG